VSLRLVTPSGRKNVATCRGRLLLFTISAEGLGTAYCIPAPRDTTDTVPSDLTLEKLLTLSRYTRYAYSAGAAVVVVTHVPDDLSDATEK
jgi:hypothetical protein